MAFNPCNLRTSFRNDPKTSDGVIGQSLDVQLNNYPFYLSLGLTCADIKPDFDANAAGPWIAGTFLSHGESFARPTVGDIVFTFPNIPDFYTTDVSWGSNYGFGVSVTEIVINPDGLSTSQISRGSLDVAYMVTGSACGGGPGDPNPLIHYEQVITDSLTGTFPIVIGAGTTVGVIIGVTGYNGPPPFTGVQACALTTTTFSDNITGNLVWPNPQPEIPYSYSSVTGINDPEALWCCVTEGVCCSAPPVGSGGKFLIPPNNPPLPGEENATTPVLNKAIYLSNYTFQFVNNFGRVNKI